MELVSALWDVLSCVLVFFLGMVVAYLLGRIFFSGSLRAFGLYIWHTIFCFVYFFYVSSVGGDAIGYYNKALAGEISVGFGTPFIESLTWVLVSILSLPILGAFLVYNIFGFIGLLAFDASLRSVTWCKSKNVRLFATVMVLLPSISFWSSAIGKDAVAFMAVGLSLWAALDLRGRLPLMAFAVFVMLLVRPHMAGMLIIALAAAYLLQNRLSIFRRFILGGLVVSMATVLVPLSLDYVGLRGDIDIGSIEAYVERRQGYNQDGGGGIDVSSMSFPMQLFAYLFRPLPFEAHSIPSLAASLDNMILIFLVLTGGGKLLRRRARGLTESRAFMWSYILMAWPILAMTTANLGISVRQKWMFAPMLIFLLISVVGSAKRSVRYSSIHRRYAAGGSAADVNAV